MWADILWSLLLFESQLFGSWPLLTVSVHHLVCSLVEQMRHLLISLLGISPCGLATSFRKRRDAMLSLPAAVSCRVERVAAKVDVKHHHSAKRENVGLFRPGFIPLNLRVSNTYSHLLHSKIVFLSQALVPQEQSIPSSRLLCST